MTTLLLASCQIALPAEPPEWVEMIPAGPRIDGVDSRWWLFDTPARVVDAFRADFTARNRRMVIDWEHATEKRAPQGLDAPAAGWVDTVELRGNALWGHVAEWTGRAAQQISAKEYRGLSSVFYYEKNTQRIVRLKSAGLTNEPNLLLTALNQAEVLSMNPEDLRRIAALLGLPETATIEQIVAAISELKGNMTAAENRAAYPSLTLFVPRAEYDAAVVKAANAEQKLNEHLATQREQEIESLVQDAITAGQIEPAAKDYFLAQCRKEGGVAEFKAFIDKKAPVVTTTTTMTAGKPPGDGGKKPDGVALGICRSLGITEEQYAKSLEAAK